jgi:hypothetical protein
LFGPIIPNWENTPNDHKLYQTAINNTKWPYYIPNGRKIYRHFPFHGPLKITQIALFGLKISHLATLFPKRTCKVTHHFHVLRTLTTRKHYLVVTPGGRVTRLEGISPNGRLFNLHGFSKITEEDPHFWGYFFPQ